MSIFYVIAYCRQIGENVESTQLSHWAVIARNWFIVFVVSKLVIAGTAILASNHLSPSQISTPLGSVVVFGLMLFLLVSGFGVLISHVFMLTTADRRLGGKIE